VVWRPPIDIDCLGERAGGRPLERVDESNDQRINLLLAISIGAIHISRAFLFVCLFVLRRKFVQNRFRFALGDAEEGPWRQAKADSGWGDNLSYCRG